MLRRVLPWLLLVLVVAFGAWKLAHSHFDWRTVARSFGAANAWLIVAAVLLIYSNNVIRAWRWAIFLQPAWTAVDPTHHDSAVMHGAPSATKYRVGWAGLVGSQFIGFSGLALFGRIGELIRPLLLARRTGLTFASQVAVLTMERVFDLAAFGLIFALNLLLSPAMQQVPYLHRAGYTLLALMLAVSGFVVAVWIAGDATARVLGRLVARFSATGGEAIEARVLEFRAGLAVISGVAALLQIAALSLLLWSVIACAYVLVLRAFPAPLAQMGVSATIVLMGFSIAGSALPVPGGGGAWAGNTFALATIFHMPAELAVSAALMVWLVTTWSIVPAGLVFARVQRISLRELVRGA